MAKFKKRADGRYQAQVATGKYTDDGKPIKAYVYARSIKELEEKIAMSKTAILEDRLIFDKTTTFGQYAVRWLEIYKKSRGIATIAMYRNVIEKHCNDIADTSLCDISRIAIQNIVNSKSEHPRICEQIVLTIKQILESALQEGLILKNVCSGIEMPRHIPKEKRILTSEEVQKLKDFVLPLNERVFIATLYGTGMRSAEMYALTKSDIDFSKSTIRICKSVVFDGNNPIVSHPKTNKSIRTVIISRSLLKLLKEYTLTIPYDNLFGDENGQILKKWQYRDMFDRIVHKVFGKDTDITPHCLRHTFCTLCYESGMSLKACQAQMGHSSYKMVLDVYTHLDSKRENIQEKMDDICL